MKFKLNHLITLLLFGVISSKSFAQPVTTDQDAGLPYTRSAFSVGLAAMSDYIVLFDGSRYAYVKGKKIRISNNDLLRGEAFTSGDDFFVPVTFAGILQIKKINTKPIPKGLEILKERWVYDIGIPIVDIPLGIDIKTYNHEQYFAINQWAKKLGKHIYQDNTGLLLISNDPIRYDGHDLVLSECITSLFDTPEKYMDPKIATKYIPWLKEQKEWTEHAKADKKGLERLYNGPEKIWNTCPKSDYDFSGFNYSLLGSKVPAPGIYPRLLFSPEDIPMIKQQITSNKISVKTFVETEYLLGTTWFDEKTSDGQLFNLLAGGDVNKIKDQMKVPEDGPASYHVPRFSKDHKPGIYNSHINYVTNCLTSIAFYALMTDNNELGKKTANAIVTYFKLVEPKVEEHLRTSDSEFGVTFEGGGHSTTHWRGMHNVVPHMDMAFALDFSGKWMDENQKKFMQNLIAKATYGRRTGGGDGPRRAWRDNNHVAWHLTHFLALAAIEGLDGFDKEAYLSGEELTNDFLDWGIDRNGQIFESNGKSAGGLQFEFLSMITLARRGNNLFGHPHLRKVFEAQFYVTAPNAKRTITSGTYAGTAISGQFASEMKAFYPDNQFADYLLTNIFPEIDLENFDAVKYREKLNNEGVNRMRLNGVTYPGGFGFPGFPYAGDWTQTRREELDIALDWETDEYGMFTSFSDKTEDATWINMQVRDNHYLGAGHHHADAGMFHFSALGVNWFSEISQGNYDSKYHNLVLIDGVAGSDKTPAKAEYLGASLLENGAVATADLSYFYSWKWCTQVKDWGEPFSFSTLGNNQPYEDFVWELETMPEIMDYFRGTTKYKMRPWWGTSNNSNFIPTLRAPMNPVKYVYRSTGLVRGNHSYGIIVDDAEKDDMEQLYEWTGLLGEHVWITNFSSPWKNSLILGYDEKIEGNSFSSPVADKLNSIVPGGETPLLLVYVARTIGYEDIGVAVSTDGPKDRAGEPQKYCRLTIGLNAQKANFRVLLIPLENKNNLPEITEENGEVILKWNEQEDIIDFTIADDNRTRFSVVRDGKIVCYSK